MNFWSSIDNAHFRLDPKSQAVLRNSCKNKQAGISASSGLNFLYDHIDLSQDGGDSDLVSGLKFFNAGDTASALSCFTASMKNNNPWGALALGNILEQKFLEIYGNTAYHIGSDAKIDEMLNLMIAAYMFGAIFAESAAEEINVEERMANIANRCDSEEQFQKVCDGVVDNLQNYILQSPELMSQIL